MISSTPKTRANPEAIRAYPPPVSIPWMTATSMSAIAPPFLSAIHGSSPLPPSKSVGLLFTMAKGRITRNVIRMCLPTRCARALFSNTGVSDAERVAHQNDRPLGPGWFGILHGCLGSGLRVHRHQLTCSPLEEHGRCCTVLPVRTELHWPL